MYMVTNLQSGRTCFGSPNWTTEFCLVQSAHSGFRVMPCVQGLPVVISAGKMCLEFEGKSKTQSIVIVQNEWSCNSTP